MQYVGRVLAGRRHKDVLFALYMMLKYSIMYNMYNILHIILYIICNVGQVSAGQRHKDVLFALSVVADDQDPQVKPETAILTNSSNLTI